MDRITGLSIRGQQLLHNTLCRCLKILVNYLELSPDPCFVWSLLEFEENYLCCHIVYACLFNFGILEALMFLLSLCQKEHPSIPALNSHIYSEFVESLRKIFSSANLVVRCKTNYQETVGL